MAAMACRAPTPSTRLVPTVPNGRGDVDKWTAPWSRQRCPRVSHARRIRRDGASESQGNKKGRRKGPPRAPPAARARPTAPAAPRRPLQNQEPRPAPVGPHRQQGRRPRRRRRASPPRRAQPPHAPDRILASLSGGPRRRAVRRRDADLELPQRLNVRRPRRPWLGRVRARRVHQRPRAALDGSDRVLDRALAFTCPARVYFFPLRL